MQFPLTAFLNFNLLFTLAVGYKLPFYDREVLQHPDNSFLVKATQIESETLDNLEMKYPRLFRKKRENDNDTNAILEMDSSTPFSHTTKNLNKNNIDESLLTESTEATPLVIITEAILIDSETNSGPPDQNLTQTIYHNLETGVTNTPLKPSDSVEHTSLLSSTHSPDVITPEGLIETTKNDHINTVISHFTNHTGKDTHHGKEQDTSSPPSEIPSFSPSKSTVNSTVTSSSKTNNLTDITAQTLHHSTSSSVVTGVTFMATSTEHASPTVHYLMKQCMLAILILAVVCTIFIVLTIALAAKLSTVKNHYRLRQANFTEMTCITSLLPESDQQSKVKPKMMKTFTANVEESDGDNTTLNSFLPDNYQL